MSNYATLISSIEDNIKQNGANAITGDLLQQVLLSMITYLGAGYQFGGVAKLTPTPTDPGTPDYKVAYIASEPGVYSNFGGIVLVSGEVAIIKGSGASWEKDTTGIASAAAVVEKTIEIDNVQQPVLPTYTEGAEYKVGNQVVYDGTPYSCRVAHTAGAFDASKWSEIFFIQDAEDYAAVLASVKQGGEEVAKIYSACVVIDRWFPRRVDLQVGETCFGFSEANGEETRCVFYRKSPGGEGVGVFAIPFIVGARYLYNGLIYIWNGENLQLVSAGYEIAPVNVRTQYQNSFIYAPTGRVVSTASDFIVSYPIPVDKGDVVEFYITATTSVAVVAETDAAGSFYKPLFIGSTEWKRYRYVAERDTFIAVSGAIPQSSKNTIVRRPISIIKQNISWAIGQGIAPSGFLSMTVSNVSTSNPIPVRAGDILRYHFYGNPAYCAICGSVALFNTFQGTSFKPFVVPTSAGEQDVEYMCKEDGFVVLCSRTLETSVVASLEIVRTWNRQQAAEAEEQIESKSENNFVDKYDFVPNLAAKRINGTLVYRADDKVNSAHIVNAVAYPNGEIIACRDGGDVVKIARDGTETVLLQIPNATDWRLCYIDSKLNVFVSPHSSLSVPGVAVANRGLYRLTYGASSFTKVLELYSNADVMATKWAANTAYSVGAVVFYDTDGRFYHCTTAHTSQSSFDPGMWGDFPAWAANTAYSVGDIVVWANNWYECKTAHTSGASFDPARFYPLIQCMTNDDTIWTMCEDSDGNLYAGVYAHSYRRNPAVYVSSNSGASWRYRYNFANGVLSLDKYSAQARHVHCINYNDYDKCLYAAVGEINTIVKSSDWGATWQDLGVICYYGQPTYVLGVKDGVVIGSDGHYSCGVSKLYSNMKTVKLCGRTAPGFIFNIRRSDITGWLYAFTRIDNILQDPEKCPPIEAKTDPAALQDWKDNVAAPGWLGLWTLYNQWATKYYPEDAIRPEHAVVLVSRDNGDTWEVMHYQKVSNNNASICGFITVGYFRDGECLAAVLESEPDTEIGMVFARPIVVSEGKKKYAPNGGYDLAGEIFIVTNTNTIIPV